MTLVSATPVAIVRIALRTTRRIPKRAMKAAAKGPMRPKRIRLMETAAAISARFQPNSRWRGMISTPGATRVPAAARSVTKVMPPTIQA